MENIIVDTDILIDLIRDIPQIVAEIKKLETENKLCTTDINAFELYWGAYKSKQHEKELTSVKRVLNTLFIASTSEDSMEVAAKIITDLEKSGSIIPLRDLFIGAICLTNSFKLLTRNKKHYENIEGLKLL